jgi:hypothetical protein
VSLGGLAWLAGVLILELTFDSSSKTTLPVGFLMLAVFAAMAVGLGRLERTAAKPSGPWEPGRVSRMGSPRGRYRLLPSSEPRVSQGSDSATTYAR